LGIKSELLKTFGKETICSIVDVTDFVKQQKRYFDCGILDQLTVPVQSTYVSSNEDIFTRIGLNGQE